MNRVMRRGMEQFKTNAELTAETSMDRGAY